MPQTASDASNFPNLPGIAPKAHSVLTPLLTLRILRCGLVIIPALVLFGWYSDNTTLMRVQPGFIAMNPLTAALFISMGLSFVCFERRGDWSNIGAGIALLVALLGAVKLIEIASGGAFVDQLIFHRAMQSAAVPNPMAPNTAISFLLLGAAVCSLHLRGTAAITAAVMCAVIALFLAILALAGYLANLQSLTRISSYTPMALHTALLIVLVVCALIFGFKETIESISSRFIWRIFTGYLFALAISTVLIAVLIDGRMKDIYIKASYGRLKERAMIMATLASSSFDRQKLEEANNALAVLGDKLSMQLELVAPDGSVLVGEDNQFSPATLSDRPEIVAARAGGIGTAEAQDPLNGERRMYAAAAVQRESDVIGYARTSIPTASVLASLLELRGTILYGAGIAALLMLPLSLLFARRITGPLVAMSEWAVRIAAGEQAQPPSTGRTDEIGALIRSCKLMAEKLGLRLSHSEVALSAAEQARINAEAASEAKSAFLANMSHDIRTPLNGIVGLLELISQQRLDVQVKRYIELAKQSAKSLAGVISNILDFSKIEAGKIELDLHGFELRELAEQTVELFGRAALNKGLELSCIVQSDLPEMFIGDSERIRQVLINIIGNALKFTEAGDILVKVSGERLESGKYDLCFLISDTGIGINEEQRERLFESYTQADRTTSRKFGGTGLGLAICKSIVELMEGAIGVDSVPGDGSTFWFSVPLYSVIRARPSFARSINPKSIRVLVVDDSAAQRDALQEQLSSLGFPVMVADSTVTAIEQLKAASGSSEQFTVVLIDEDMPGVDGKELSRMIRAIEQLRPTVLMILLCKDCVPTEDEMRELGFSGSLSKPIRQSHIFDAIISAIHSKQTEISSPPASGPSALVAPKTNGRRILIVEDNEINQIVAVEILSASGYHCDVAQNGQQALERLLDKVNAGYDVILMDCQMPVMDGFEATTRIREAEIKGGSDGTRIPIIAITANVVRGDAEKCIAAGMDAYVSKPIDPETLVTTIENVLKGRKISAGSSGNVGRRNSSDGPIDLAVLMKRSMNNVEVVHRLLSKFSADIPQIHDELSNAIARLDQEASAEIVHTFKGVAGMIAATRLHCLVSELEQLISERRLIEASNRIIVVSTELRRCLSAVPALIGEISAIS